MSDIVNITIDGKVCTAKEGEFILNVARANDIFVPAICYQTKCTPTLACRLCLVEADGKQVYACNAKAKDGMNISVNTPNIEKERKAIMEVYDVNHPLQCGVCDQSGECELQNYSLYMEVDKQNYSVKDVDRPTSDWGVMKYDPGLCIVCEKCVSVCKDMIGSNALGTVKRGADALDASFKGNMPKDAYAMWNKLNKNLIGFTEEKCIDCGECIAVCPVGALVSSDFQYKSNAWELKKIPASNPYSSDCSLIYYEIKHDTIKNNTQEKIYRVTNDAHYTSLSGATRFAFDFTNKATKIEDNDEFSKAIDMVKNADTIVFNSFITNEEALILQKIKEKFNLKLVNKDAYNYKSFLEEYSKVSGNSLYTGTIDDVHNAKFLVSVGSYLKSDAPAVKYAFNNAISMNKAFGTYFHPMGDTHIEGFGKKGKSIETVASNPLSEDAILYFILDKFGVNMPNNITEYLNSLKETRVKSVTETIKEKVTETTVDPETKEEKTTSKMVPKKVTKDVEYVYTKLIDLIGTDEKFLESFELAASGVKDGDFILIIGEDCITHPNSSNIARLCGMVERYTQFKVLITPTQTNTLGVSMICDLDEEISGKTVGYNVKADYELSSFADGNLNMPVLHQQEGTFLNINKTVVPTNAALAYNGYELNDIANSILDDKKDYVINYTKELFKNIEFDNLDNYFSNDRVEHRGYTIENEKVTIDETLTVQFEENRLKIEENEYIIYNGNPINQFNEFTAVAHQLKNDIVALYISESLKEKLALEENNIVSITSNNTTMNLEFKVDKTLVGDISYIPTYDKNINTQNLFNRSRFSVSKLRKA
ncbi:MAG: NADH-quinone oxidoreductase subunit G [Campylobacterota bacterium]|nr:NADH-quinone oxidoreductase subunit G [Campylobacterota bacterium]